MTKFFGFASLLLSIIAPFGNAAALPNGITGADMVYPEVVPGPGLPSLAELGLSSKKLYEMPRKPSKITSWSSPFPEAHMHLVGPPIPVDGNHAKRAATSTPGCVGAKSDSANVDDVIACFNYMVEAGGVVFFVPNDEDQHILCTSGTAYVYAVDVGRWPTVGASALYELPRKISFC